MKVFGLWSSVFGLPSVSRRSRGFTLLEVTLVAGLTSFFTLLMASSWHSWGRSLADSHARCIVAQEANLAIETLHRDLGGYRLEQATGTKDENRIIGTLITGGSQLRLCYDGTPINGIADW